MSSTQGLGRAARQDGEKKAEQPNGRGQCHGFAYKKKRVGKKRMTVSVICRRVCLGEGLI